MYLQIICNFLFNGLNKNTDIRNADMGMLE